MGAHDASFIATAYVLKGKSHWNTTTPDFMSRGRAAAEILCKQIAPKVNKHCDRLFPNRIG